MDPVTFELSGDGGVRLAGDRWGDPSAPPVVFLHGGGQTRHSWAGSARAVAEAGWQAVTVDARGHGSSAWSEAGDYRLVTFARDVGRLAGGLERRPVLVGASLGGLTSMLLVGELDRGCAAGVVLVDIVPDMEQAGADRIQAFMADRLSEGFGSLDEVADAIAAYNPHRPRPDDLSGLAKNLRERDGRWYWHWDPGFIDGSAPLPPAEINDTGRLYAALEQLVADEVPLLLVRGRSSDLVSAKRADAFCRRFPSCGFVDVSGAGHMVAGDRNDAFTAAVLGFLDSSNRCS
jgi:peroxiredoxin